MLDSECDRAGCSQRTAGEYSLCFSGMDGAGELSSFMAGCHWDVVLEADALILGVEVPVCWIKGGDAEVRGGFDGGVRNDSLDLQ